MREVFTTDKDRKDAQWKDAYGHTYTSEYRCWECGCTFYGMWHSSYSMHEVRCPVCGDETDTMMIEYTKNIRLSDEC